MGCSRKDACPSRWGKLKIPPLTFSGHSSKLLPSPCTSIIIPFIFGIDLQTFCLINFSIHLTTVAFYKVLTQTGKFTKYCAHNTWIFECVCAPALSRQKIAHLDSPYILVCVRRILIAHGRSSMRTTTFQSGC